MNFSQSLNIRTAGLVISLIAVALLSSYSVSNADTYYDHGPYVDFQKAKNACIDLLIFDERCDNTEVVDGVSRIHYTSLQPGGYWAHHYFYYGMCEENQGPPPCQ